MATRLIHEILWDVKQFRGQISELKKHSVDYPVIYETNKGGVFWASTLVTYIFNGKKYKRHHVEYCIITNDTIKGQTLMRLEANCELTKAFGQPCQFDEEITEN